MLDNVRYVYPCVYGCKPVWEPHRGTDRRGERFVLGIAENLRSNSCMKSTRAVLTRNDSALCEGEFHEPVDGPATFSPSSFGDTDQADELRRFLFDWDQTRRDRNRKVPEPFNVELEDGRELGRCVFEAKWSAGPALAFSFRQLPEEAQMEAGRSSGPLPRGWP